MEFRHIKTDALVIGGGVAGYMAAYWMGKGLKITLLNTGRGASPFITGYNVPVMDGDSVNKFYDDTYESGRRQGTPDLIRIMAEGSIETVPFLKKLGFCFDMEDGHFRIRRPIGSSYPRVIGNGNISGKIIGDLLQERLKTRDNVELLNSVRILRLFKKDGKVCGAFGIDGKTGESYCFDARAVILATGGFCKIYEFSSNTADIGGDGIAMAYDMGVPLVDMEFVQFEPSGAVWPLEIRGHGMITTLNHEGAVIKNNQGERFMFRYAPEGELVNKDVLGRCIFKEVEEGRGSPHGGVWFDCTAVGETRLHEAYEMFYQRYARHGIDISKEPIEIFPTAHTSLGGVSINNDCMTILPGLFACGEIVGGLYGSNRIGGTAGTEVQVFGKRAGIAARKYLEFAGTVEFATEDEWSELRDKVAGVRGKEVLSEEKLNDIRSDMKSLLSEAFNVIRNGEKMKNASNTLKELLDEVEESGRQMTGAGILAKMRLQNDLQTAYLLSLSAIKRKESCGCHWRSDDTELTGHRYRIQIKSGKERCPVISQIPLDD